MLSKQDFSRIHTLFENGRYLTAYREFSKILDLRNTDSAEDMVLAGRLANNLCNFRLGDALHLSALRRHPESDKARYYGSFVRTSSTDPIRAWEFLKRWKPADDANVNLRSDWMMLEARTLSRLRDFENATKIGEAALGLTPGRPWTLCARSFIYELQDFYSEAAELVDEALRISPTYRPAVQAKAHLLRLMNRDEEALHFLESAAQRLESPLVLLELHTVQSDLGDPRGAFETFERAIEFIPDVSKEMKSWIVERKSILAYECEDVETSIEFGKQVDTPFMKRTIERMEKNRDGVSKKLGVKFVRQHHRTCGSATLTAVSNYFGREVEHLSVVEQINFDGTTAYFERKWAEEMGFTVREFNVDFDSSMKLIDADIPFTLATTGTTFGHLQAVIGYDSRCGWLLVQDPYQRSIMKYDAEGIIESFRSTGPRGMALIPPGKEFVAKSIQLPGASAYDMLYEFQKALHNHERDRAEKILEKMENEAKDERILCVARISLAGYDVNDSAILKHVERILELFPDDFFYQSSRLRCLYNLSREEVRAGLLKQLAQKEKTDSLFFQYYGQYLIGIPDKTDLGAYYIRKAFRYNPGVGDALYDLAVLRFRAKDYDRALELYRFSACMEQMSEFYSMAYFQVANYLGKEEEVIGFLRRRVEQHGRKYSGPAMTLANALESLERTDEAFKALSEQLERTPEDEGILLYAADVYIRYGDSAKANEFIERARPFAKRTSWLKKKAVIAAYKPDLEESLRLWKEVLRIEPLSMDAHREVAQLSAETLGREKAIEHLREATKRFPYHLELNSLYISWLRTLDDLSFAVEPLVKMITYHPTNAWAQTTLAEILLSLRELRGAYKAALEGVRLARHSAQCWSALARVSAEFRGAEEAAKYYRKAIKISPDETFAIGEYLYLLTSTEDKRKALAFVYKQLMKGTSGGPGIEAYFNCAYGVLSEDEIVKNVRRLYKLYPNLAIAHSTYIELYIELNDLGRALKLALRAIERFPLDQVFYLQKADILGLRGETKGQIETLRYSMTIVSEWGSAPVKLAAALMNEGDFEEACKVLKEAIAKRPLASQNYFLLASVLERTGDVLGSIETFEHALNLSPRAENQWLEYFDLCRGAKLEKRAIEFTRDCAKRRKGDAHCQMMLSSVLGGAGERDEALKAVDSAIELDPMNFRCYDQKAVLLTQKGEFEKALAVCQPESFGDRIPVQLEGRRGRILFDMGKTEEAISLLENVAEENPGYLFAFDTLYECYKRVDNREKLLSAADRIVRLSPHNFVSYGIRGQANSICEKRDEAVQDLTSALKLNPSYYFAANLLASIYEKEQKFEEAYQIISEHARHNNSPQVLSILIFECAKLGKEQKLLKHLRELCRMQTDDEYLIAGTLRDVSPKGRIREKIGEIVEEELALNPDSVAIARALIQLWTTDKPAKKIRSLIKKNESREEIFGVLVCEYLHHIGKVRASAEAKYIFAKYKDRLRKDDKLWGHMGWGLTALTNSKPVVSWLSDFAERKDLKVWMLTNMLVGLRDLGERERSDEIIDFALTFPRDGSTKLFHLWRSIDLFLDDDASAAEESYKNIDSRIDNDDQQILDAALLLLDTLRELRTEGGPDATRKAEATLRKFRNPLGNFVGSRAIDRVFAKTLEIVATESKSLSFRLWARWKRFRLRGVF
ncbi:MAG: tetratricopeptide repeat protein [Planctomycetes bacterium]|nr:tetratricopeptide repeat protein [Planctomycetota bacterium]